MPRPAPLPDMSKEIVAPDALRAFKQATAAKTTAKANRWLAVAMKAQDAYVENVRTKGIASGTTRRKVFGRGRGKRTRKSRSYLGRWL
jgi:hypothetical protein